ncbi:signal peptidase II [soil metagenome]|nr:signal peptidase II [Gemmatimonadota bacterium]
MTRHEYRWLAGGIAVLVAADWASKLWVLNRIPLGDTRAVVEGWLYFAHRQNTGVAFSMFADLPAFWGPLLLSAFSLIAIVLFVRMMRETPDPAGRGAMALVIAGAIGNLGDRLVTGSVTDFILVSFFPYVFNIADAVITVGGVVLVAYLLFGGRSAQSDPVSARS